MSVLFSILLYAFWSIVFPLGKWTLQFSPPLFLTGVRALLSGLILIAFLALFRKKALVLRWQHVLPLLVLAFFSVYLTNALEFWGLQQLSAAKTCFIYSLSPFFAALLSFFHFGEKMTREKWIGLCMGFLGILPILAQQTGSEEFFHAYAFFSWPTIAVMGAAFVSVYGWVLLRALVKNHTLPPSLITAVSMIFGGIFALLHSYLFEHWNPIPVGAGEISLFLRGMTTLMIISNLLCYTFYGMLLKRFTATFLSLIGLLSPIFASLYSWFFLREPISLQMIASTGIVFLSLWIVHRAELKQGYMRATHTKPT
jgi:drug/metabolite transporter (DMT)-like permease